MSDIAGLIAFLRARYAERERVADAVPMGERSWNTEHGVLSFDAGNEVVVDWAYVDGAADHMAANDPTAVLSDFAAAQAVVDDCAEWTRSAQSAPDDDAVGGLAAESVLRLLAVPYSRHPDYDEAWRPEL